MNAKPPKQQEGHEAPVEHTLRPMPDDLVERLFSEFKSDKHSWDEFAKREHSFVKNRVEEPPHRAEIVEEFVRQRLGPRHGYWTADLIIKIRKQIHGL
jgi:hypothetical protein